MKVRTFKELVALVQGAESAEDLRERWESIRWTPENLSGLRDEAQWYCLAASSPVLDRELIEKILRTEDGARRLSNNPHLPRSEIPFLLAWGLKGPRGDVQKWPFPQRALLAGLARQGFFSAGSRTFERLFRLAEPGVEGRNPVRAREALYILLQVPELPDEVQKILLRRFQHERRDLLQVLQYPGLTAEATLLAWEGRALHPSLQGEILLLTQRHPLLSKQPQVRREILAYGERAGSGTAEVLASLCAGAQGEDVLPLFASLVRLFPQQAIGLVLRDEADIRKRLGREGLALLFSSENASVRLEAVRLAERLDMEGGRSSLPGGSDEVARRR